ncbi:MAG: tyrosine-type recombinase/integrase [Gammaproteobacteria bacterium]|nr:tyrosine-type recombinase/integrase [Gammaproteobacteria bacterium]
MAGKITAQQIKSMLKANKPGYYAVGNGLYFRISKERTGFWVLRYTMHGKRHEISLGRYPDISLADANGETAILKSNIKKNIDPLAERQRADFSTVKTVDDLAEDWLKDCEKRLKHPQIPRRVYTKDLAPMMGRLAIEQVTPRDIRAVIVKIAESDRPTIANDALMYCKQLFRHGIKLDLLTSNPAEPFTVSDAGGVEQSRSRYLSFDEVSVMFQAFHKYSDQFTRENTLAAALLVTLGVRKGELIAARWEEFDTEDKLWHLPQERCKTGVAISVPLSDEVLEWLQELYIRANGAEYVFPKRRSSVRFGHISPDTLNAAIQKLHSEDKMPIDHFTVHDLRRTCRSLLASEGVSGHVAERCLNHKLKGVEGIYDRHDYLDERREALQLISNKLAPVINQSSAQVLNFNRRKAAS